MRQNTPTNQVLFKQVLRAIVLGLFVVSVGFAGLSLFAPARTSAATSSSLNFQARLETAGGAIVPDGNYNVEFKLYNASSSSGSSQGSCTGDSACLWTETRTSANQVRVVNGYLTVNLGSVTAFGSINWNQQLWLTMRIGGTGTPSWDAEMSPRIQLTAVPYAFQAGSLSATSGANVGTLSFGSITGTDTITLPDASGTVCLQSASACGFATGSGTAFLQGGNTFSGSTAGELGTNNNGVLNFRTNNTDKLQLDTSGNLIFQQASTVNAASATTGTVLTIQGGAATSGTNVGGNLVLQGGAGASTGASGSVIVKSNTNNSASAFVVQNASSSNILSVSTSNLGSWATTSSMTAVEQVSSAITNGYAYIIGGTTTGAAAGGVQTVQYTKVNTDGTLGTWSTTNALPSGAGRTYASQTAPVWNGYIYHAGGYNTSGTVQPSVYYAKVNPDGTLGSWAATTSMTIASAEGEMVAANGYLYWIGGYNGSSVVATSYYAKINADGTVGSWTSTGLTLPSNLSDFQAVVSNGYIYTVGGWTGSTDTNDIFSAKLNSDGTLGGTSGNWFTPSTVSGNSLPGTGLNDASAAVVNGYLYVIGGATSGGGPGTAATYAFPLPADGSSTMGTRTILTGTLGGNRWKGSVASANGYIYYLGGDGATGTTASGTVYYGSATRISIAGDLDLVGLTNGVLSGQSNGGGGSIYAGNIYSVGNLSVQGNTTLRNGLSVNGAVVFKDNANSTGAFQIQNTLGTSILNVDTANQTLTVHSGNDVASDGSELYSGNFGTSWTTTGWTLGGSNTTAAHNTGNTSSLVDTGHVAITAGTVYRVQFNLSGTCATITAGERLSVYIGGTFLGRIAGADCTGTVSYIGAATNTTGLTLTPTSNWPTTVSGISIEIVSNVVKPVLTVQNASASPVIEVRANANTTSTYIGIGSGAYDVNGGGENTALGYQSLQSNSTGSNNVAVGSYALQGNTDGYGNTAIGDIALENNSTGTNNTAVGNDSLWANTTGQYNTAVGTDSLSSNTSGSRNVAVGQCALCNNASGSYNVALGYFALGNMTSGDSNIGIGLNALRGNLTGSQNIALGYSAGDSDSNGNFSTLSALQNAAAIGAYAQVQANNSIVLGSVDIATKVGIGITVPSNMFSVSPLDYQTGTATRTNSSATLTGASTTWTSAMVGDIIVFADGTTNTVSAFTDATHITMGTTYTGTTDASPVHYRFHKVGFQVTSAGNAYLQNTSATAFQVQNASGSSLLTADTSSQVLTVAVNTSSGSAALKVTQAGSGDATINLSDAGQNWSAGVSASYLNSFSINSSNALPTATSTNYGRSSIGASTDTSNGNQIDCSQFLPTTNGYITSLSAHTGTNADASPHNHFGMAVYDTSWNLLGSGSGTLSATPAWNTISVTPFTITGGLEYWICANNDSTSASLSNWTYSATSSSRWVNSTYGSWPSYLNTTNNSSLTYDFYASLASSTASFTLGTSGNAAFKLTADSTTAFQVQNASGTSALNLDTTQGTLNLYPTHYYESTGSNMMTGDFSSGWTTTGWASPSTTVNGNQTLSAGTLVVASNTGFSTSGGSFKISTTTYTYTGTSGLTGLTGVTGTFTNGSTLTSLTTITHTAGNTSSLVNTGSLPTAGTQYEVDVKFIGPCGGTSDSVNVYVGGTYAGFLTPSDCGTFLEFVTGHVANTTGVTFVPTTGWTGTLGSLPGVYPLTAAVSPVLAVHTPDGNFDDTPLEVRATPGGIDASIYIGQGSGQYDFGWNDNTGFGIGVLSHTTNSSYNTAMGNYALPSLVNGLDNVAVGTQVLYQAENTNENVAVGSYSLYSLKQGGYNVALGETALENITIGSYDTALGFQAGQKDSGTFFATADNLQNATAVGAYAQVQASNSIVLGSVDTATKVGIGTTIPDNTFSVSPVFIDDNTNTASQSTNAITGTSTTWNSTTPVKVGMRFIFANGTDAGTITAVNSDTSLTVSTSQTVSAQHYRIHYVGFQVTSAGNTYIQTTSTIALQAKSSSGSALVTADTSNMRLGVNATYAAMTTPSSLTATLATGGSLTTSSTYKYKVTAIDSAGGETAASTEATGSPSTSAGNLTYNLAWTAVTGASGYKIYRTAANGASNSEVFLASAITNSYVDNGSVTSPGGSVPSTSTAYVSTDVSNSSLQLSVGGNGTPTGQLYVSGIVPATKLGRVSVGSQLRQPYVQGRYLYTTDNTNNNLKVLDISNPARPNVVGTLTVGSGPQGPYVQGRYAYVVNSTSNTLQIIDVSNPTSPSIVSTTSTTSAANNASSPNSVYVQGRYAYVALNGGVGALEIYDISNPAAPVMVSDTSMSTTGPSKVVAQGRYAYMTLTTTLQIKVIDVSNPASPTVTSTFSPGGNPQGIDVHGRYAYISLFSSPQALTIWDISNPASPVVTSTFTATNSGPQSVTVQGRYAYVAENAASGFLETIDVSNPAAPFSVGTVSTEAFAGGVAVSGRYAYVEGGALLDSFDMGGAYVQQLETGGLETGALSTNGNATVNGDATLYGGLQVATSVGIGGNLSVGGSAYFQGAVSLDSGILGGAVISGLSTPSAPTVTPTGGTGSTSYSYVVAAVSASGGTTPASSAGSTATGVAFASLTTSIYNAITWSPVSGAVSYNVYRTVGGTTQGLIGNTNATSLSDTGLAATTAAPTLDTSGQLTVNGYAKVSSLSAATSTSYAVCRDTSTQLFTSCDANDSRPFVQGGNSFGAQATLGTNDANSLAFETNNATRAILDTSGNITFQQATTISAATASISPYQLTIQAGSASGAPGGGNLLLQAGAGTTSNGSVIVKASASFGTIFQIQNSSGTAILAAVPGTNPQIKIGAGSTGEATPSLLVLDSETGSTSDPTEVDGAMYYNTTLAEYRCGRDGAWENCGINPIDRGFNIEDEFLGGTTGSGSIGALGWVRTAITSDCTGSYNAIAATANRPGELRETTAATLNTGCLVSLNTGDMILAAGQTMKAAFSVSSTTNEQVRVGWYAGTTQADPTTSGLWWEAVNGTANWRYCYATGAAATCANSATAVAANTFVRLEIRLTATGAGTSAATFCINGTCSTVSAVTISTATAVQPGYTCTDTSVATAISCDIDYYQLRGVASAAR